MHSRVCDLQQEIITFLRQKNLPGADNFSNLQWLARLALLTNITTHQNDFNVKQQGKKHSSCRHALAHHRLRSKVALVGGSTGCFFSILQTVGASRLLFGVSFIIFFIVTSRMLTFSLEYVENERGILLLQPQMHINIVSPA